MAVPSWEGAPPEAWKPALEAADKALNRDHLEASEAVEPLATNLSSTPVVEEEPLPKPLSTTMIEQVHSLEILYTSE